MGYWRSTAAQAFKEALADIKISTKVQFAVLLLGQAATSVLLFYLVGTVQGVSLPTRIASTIAPFVVLLLMFVYRLLKAIAGKDAENQAVINQLKADLEATEAASDVELTLNPHLALLRSDEFPPTQIISVIARNRGRSRITNCILKVVVLNRDNYDVATPVWADDASGPFDLRPGEARDLEAVFLYSEPFPLAAPKKVTMNRATLKNEPVDIEVMLPEDEHLLVCEVFSDNTSPARFALRVWYENEAWKAENTNEEIWGGNRGRAQ